MDVRFQRLERRACVEVAWYERGTREKAEVIATRGFFYLLCAPPRADQATHLPGQPVPAPSMFRARGRGLMGGPMARTH